MGTGDGVAELTKSVVGFRLMVLGLRAIVSGCPTAPATKGAFLIGLKCLRRDGPVEERNSARDFGKISRPAFCSDSSKGLILQAQCFL